MFNLFYEPSDIYVKKKSDIIYFRKNVFSTRYFKNKTKKLSQEINLKNKELKSKT